MDRFFVGRPRAPGESCFGYLGGFDELLELHSALNRLQLAMEKNCRGIESGKEVASGRDVGGL